MTSAAGGGPRVLAVLWVRLARQDDGDAVLVTGGVWSRDPRPGDYDRIADILLHDVPALIRDVGGDPGR